jgi:glycosyltransferase involved in cell wall biosynthesis
VVNQCANCRLEVLIGDDGSADETREILRELQLEYPEKIHLYFHEGNLGASGNLTFLINKAKGDFIAHLDGDDYWLPEKLALQLAALEQHPACAAVYTNGFVVNGSGSHLGMFNCGVAPEFDLPYLVRSGNFLFHSTLLYRSQHKGLILTIPGEFIDFRIHVRLASRCHILHLDAPLAVYRHGSSSSMMKTMPEGVQTRYWQALVEAAHMSALQDAISGAELFWERLFLNSFRNLWFNHIGNWWKIISTNSTIPLSRPRMIWLALRSIRLVPAILSARFQCPEVRVLYRR